MAARIILLGDDVEQLGVLSFILSDAGYDSMAVRTTDDAFTRVTESNPDLIVVHADLGEVDKGWELLLALEQEPVAPPVLIYSSVWAEIRARMKDLPRMIDVHVIPNSYTDADVVETARKLLGPSPE